MFYCVEIEDVMRSLYTDVRKVLCMESAAAFLGLSNGSGIPITFYYDAKKTIYSSSYIKGIPVISFNYKICLIRGIECTSLEQTICDMVINQSDIQTILESIANYYYENNESLEELELLANELGCLDKLKAYINDGINYYNED